MTTTFDSKPQFNPDPPQGPEGCLFILLLVILVVGFGLLIGRNV